MNRHPSAARRGQGWRGSSWIEERAMQRTYTSTACPACAPDSHTRVTRCTGEKTACSDSRTRADEERTAATPRPSVGSRRHDSQPSCPVLLAHLSLYPGRGDRVKYLTRLVRTARPFPPLASSPNLTGLSIRADGAQSNDFDICSSIRCLGGVLSRSVCPVGRTGCGDCVECVAVSAAM